MKHIKIRSLKYSDPAINWDFKAENEEQKLSELITSGVCGLPERWVLHKDEQGAKPYEEVDVLEEKTVESSEGAPQKMVKLKAEYTISIEDITAEYNLQQVILARKAEYPSPEEFMNAFFDGGEEAIEQLRQKRLEIKNRHPKP